MRSRGDELVPIVVRSYDLCAALYEHVNRLPRAQRTLLGRVILDEGLRMLAALTLANRVADKREALAQASGHLDHHPSNSSSKLQRRLHTPREELIGQAAVRVEAQRDDCR